MASLFLSLFHGGWQVKALEFPDSLREALREKLTELSCSNKQAAVVFDVETSCVTCWVNGRTKSLSPLHQAKISFFVAGYLDGLVNWLIQEAEENPGETRSLISRLFKLCFIIQRCPQNCWGKKRLASLICDVDILMKQSLAETL